MKVEWCGRPGASDGMKGSDGKGKSSIFVVCCL